MPSAASTVLNNKGDSKRPRGRAGSGVGGVRGSVMSSMLAFLRVTRWLQQFQASFLDTTASRGKEGHLQE